MTTDDTAPVAQGGEREMERAKLEEAIAEFKKWGAAGPCGFRWRLIAEAAEAHLATLPKTAMVNVWRVEFAQIKRDTLATWEAAAATFTDRDEADRYAQTVSKWPLTACIKVTGPHQQEVPA